MRKELIYVHMAVLLFGLSGLFGKWLALPAHYIVLGRVFFGALFLLLILLILKKTLRLPRLVDYLPFILIGGVLAIHWGSFFHSIQISTVAIGLVTFATFPVFASVLEPIFFKETFQKRSFVLAIITLFGVVLLIPEFDFSNNLTQGAVWGLISAVTFAVLSMLNRKYVQHHSSLKIGFYQNVFAFFWLLPIAYATPKIQFTMMDISLLVLLGVVFTGGAHVFFIQGLRKMNVRTASIIASLEPVYGIIAAAFLLQEIPQIREWIGIVIILCAAIYASIPKKI
ncbi:drug/metabolite transporter (DMT)-like permease [Evansella vedderi]|uniref:Drug/metabolite transporter (DMT)-like permease n=1 Tax=Evansella vedderi TaxID=38282 RepID=A0ABU0A1A4_9BACI|nr:EamA family transporter [Evansella vedderi]MDQ0257250.1 drug/metabolite transporter (DMT)-like permease [Evansella vedderi]